MKIAIVKLSALGDIVHTMVVLQFIKKYRPDVTIDWVVEEGFKALLVDNPDINEIHTVSIKRAKKNKSFKLLFHTLRKLKKLKKYDVVIDLQGLIKSAIVSKIIPSIKTFGFDKVSVREPLAAIFYTDTCRMNYIENVIKRNIFIIFKVLGISISRDDVLNKQPFLYCSAKFKPSILQNNKPNIAFVSGASHLSKIYPVEKFGQLALMLDANITVLWGNEKERIIAKNIQKIAPKVMISKQLSLTQLIGFIGQMNLVIGGDTGPTHMAWALNVPSILLFGPTPGYRIIFATKVNCMFESNSLVNPHKIDKNDFSIQDILVADIASKAKQILAFNAM